MFTGITRGTFPVTRVTREQGIVRYEVELDAALSAGLELGASVSIDGVCQTAVAIDGHRVGFDAIGETLAKTTLDTLALGQLVSVERSYRIGDEMGGHEVAGHVSGTGEIAATTREGENLTLVVRVPAGWMKYILSKGFVALDGSSLTIGKTDAEGTFEVYLIPETLKRTNLGNKKVGERINVELDHRTVAIVDTVERVLEQRFGKEREISASG